MASPGPQSPPSQSSHQPKALGLDSSPPGSLDPRLFRVSVTQDPPGSPLPATCPITQMLDGMAHGPEVSGSPTEALGSKSSWPRTSLELSDLSCPGIT